FQLTGQGAGGYFLFEDPAGPDGILGTEDDVPPAYGWGGQMMGPVAENGVITSTYCIDINTPIGLMDTTELGPWSDALAVVPPGASNELTGQNLQNIARIVANNFPNADGLAPLAGTNNEKALAVQWAIWHYANGF